jgi:mono/diheme cytochrome c family protein
MADKSDMYSNGSRQGLGLGITAGVLGVLAVLGIAGLITAYTGLYNVAATEEHASFTRWAFDTTFHNSVERQADGIVAPASFPPDRLAQGATAYKSMCQHCHAGPGVERDKWASGMRPRPPHLAEAAAGWSPQEVFWIVKHGVKMSGMPAFGPSHDDRAIWNIAAFVKGLPAMTPEEYKAIGGSEGGGNGGRAQPAGAPGGGVQSPPPAGPGTPPQ